MKKSFLTRKIKLSTLLTSLVAISIIFTTVILLVASYQSQRESLIDAYLHQNHSKSKKMSKSVDSLFRSMRISLEETTNFFSDTKGLTDQEIQDYLDLLIKNSRYFNSLSWIDEKGVIQSIAPVTVGLRGQTIATGVTREVLDLKKATLTTPYIAPSGRLIVLMSQPFYDTDGNYRGMIGGSIYLQEQNVLNEILGNDIMEDNGSYYYVVGPEGKLLFHPEIKRVGEAVTENSIVQELMQGKDGMKIVTNTQGVEMLAAYNSVPETGWGVVQQTPISHVNELLLNHLKKLIMYMLLPFVCILIICIVIARKLAKPFFELANHVKQLAAGKDVSVPKNDSHWNREADLLTKSVIFAIDGIQEKNSRLTYEATTDSLTKFLNRRKLDEVLRAWAQDGRFFSLVAIDIDNFKSVNDTYGHQAGDEVIKFLANNIQSKARPCDICFRYGGEEFVILLPYTHFSEAHEISELIRETVEKTVSPVGKPMTISIGISEFPLHTNSLGEIFQLADHALYESKLKGKNRVTIWSKDIMIN
ncbi:diguanylate cyclase [Cytobacillus sp. FJAT-54145]|uniref:Diguanylate cyclase n=1 Tax=Cytobacillus spartinae TaxID=3299023 RepID=A0ABW6K779_9BACI